MYAKLPTQLARLALVLHLLTHPANPAGQPLSAATMQDAIAVVEYFRAHGHRALAHFGAAALVSHPLSVRLQRILRMVSRQVVEISSECSPAVRRPPSRWRSLPEADR
jgi:hypothetical protein